MEREQLFSLAREKTNLSEVQMRILGNMQEALQFTADLTREQVIVIAAGKNEEMAVVLCTAMPSFSVQDSAFTEGDVYFMNEVALAESVLMTGKKIVGRKELEIGKKVALTAYPVIDNAGTPFAAVGFMANSLKQQQVLIDTAYMALQMPLMDTSYYPPKMQDGLLILDSMGRIMYANDMAAGLCFVLDKEAAEQKNILGRVMYANDMAAGLCFVLDKEAAEQKNILGRVMVHWPLVEKMMETGHPDSGEEEAGGITVSAWGLPILMHGKVSRTILILTDVTAVREKEQQILVKNSVIKEIHHRVKNNLNTIAGILRMQSRRAENEETKEALRRAVDRILGISQIHEILARQSGENVDWHELLSRLCKLSLDSLTASSHVELVTDLEEKPLVVASEKAVTLAIAVNELIHNALDHGFENQPYGILTIIERIEDGMLHIRVINDGNLLPENFGSKSYDLGLQIVKTLVEIELKGKFTFGNEARHVVAHIRCPLSGMKE